MQLTLRDNWIEGNAISFKGSYPVLEAVLVLDRVLVTYDWMAFENDKPARNLFCYDRAGNLLWRADTIAQGAADAYTGVISDSPLWVGNFAGFNCRIDLSSGKVLETVLTK